MNKPGGLTGNRPVSPSPDCHPRERGDSAGNEQEINLDSRLRGNDGIVYGFLRINTGLI
jgi:hypothetical protein